MPFFHYFLQVKILLNFGISYYIMLYNILYFIMVYFILSCYSMHGNWAIVNALTTYIVLFQMLMPTGIMPRLQG